MNLLESAYEILVTLLVCDGKYDDNEARAIAEFLADNHDGSFDPHTANERLMKLDKATLEARLETAAAQVRDHSTLQDREAILEFGIDLVMADGELSEDENRLVRHLAEVWEVSLQPIVARVLS